MEIPWFRRHLLEFRQNTDIYLKRERISNHFLLDQKKKSWGPSVKLWKIRLGGKTFPTQGQNVPTRRKMVKYMEKFTLQLKSYPCNDKNNFKQFITD